MNNDELQRVLKEARANGESPDLSGPILAGPIFARPILSGPILAGPIFARPIFGVRAATIKKSNPSIFSKNMTLVTHSTDCKLAAKTTLWQNGGILKINAYYKWAVKKPSISGVKIKNSLNKSLNIHRLQEKNHEPRNIYFNYCRLNRYSTHDTKMVLAFDIWIMYFS